MSDFNFLERGFDLFNNFDYGDGNDHDGDDEDDNIMNCFCGMVDQKKLLTIPSRHLPAQS